MNLDRPAECTGAPTETVGRVRVRGSFLCESCGYPLEDDSHPDDVCPECGRSVGSSMPSARGGTPWQQRPGPLSYLATMRLVLSSPRRVWADVRLDRSRAIALLSTTLLFTGVGGSVLLLTGIAHVWYILAFSTAFTLVLAVLTLTEMGGLHFFGRRRGFRMVGNVPLVICAHAAYAWWVSVAGMVLVSRVGYWMIRVGFPGSAWLQGAVWILGVRVPHLVALVVAAFLIGMILYSLISGAGFYAMRHVNRPAIDE